jgi:hypothetical protein
MLGQPRHRPVCHGRHDDSEVALDVVTVSGETKERTHTRDDLSGLASAKARTGFSDERGDVARGDPAEVDWPLPEPLQEEPIHVPRVIVDGATVETALFAGEPAVFVRQLQRGAPSPRRPWRPYRPNLAQNLEQLPKRGSSAGSVPRMPAPQFLAKSRDDRFIQILQRLAIPPEPQIEFRYETESTVHAIRLVAELFSVRTIEGQILAQGSVSNSNPANYS